MERGQKMRGIADAILEVAESMSPVPGEIVHLDTLRVTAVIVNSILAALAKENKDPEIGIRAYRDEFLRLLDPILDG